MKKIISVIFFLVLAVTLVTTVSATLDLSGSWSGFGYFFKAQQSGSSITLIATDGDIKGKVSFQGTITGNSVAGQQIMIAKGCPNLEKYVPATGTVSPDGSSITITYKNFNFDPSRCVDLSGNEFEETGSYTKVSSLPVATKPPQPTQTPQAKKATPMPTSTPSLQDQSSDSVSKPSQEGNPFSIFGFNPFQTWRNIQGLLDIPEGLNSLVQTAEILSGPTEIKIQVPEPAISTDDEGKAWNFLPGYVPPDEENIIVVKGQGQIKSSNSSQFIGVSNSSGDAPSFTTFVDSIFTGSTSEMVTLRYTWNTKSGAVINISPKAEVQFVKPVSGEAVKEAKMIMLNKGEIEIKVKNANPGNKFGVRTEILDLIVIGTHFWVSHDSDKKQTMAAVYEGKVEIKTNDGKTTTVTPNGDKPGVVVVSQKMSTVKLVIFGLVLATVAGGAIMILRRKLTPKVFSKKKK